MLTAKPYRIAIVGASTLAGKELSDTLAESSLADAGLLLLDDEDVAGQIAAAGDEAALIQKIDGQSFAGVDFVFFAGDADTTRRYWKAARLAGASIVDMTYALEPEPGVLVLGPWAPLATVEAPSPQMHEPDLTTTAVVAAHPAALLLLLIASRVDAVLPLRTIAVTLFEPASEYGRAAMDELHQQTVALLSFQSLPREQYDAQIAFNLLPSLGESAKVNLTATRARILAHYAALGAGSAPAIELQLVQAPVFHGYVASLLIELDGATMASEIERALHGESVDILRPESDPPSNISAAGQADVLVRVRATGGADVPSTRFWLWLAADNLKLASLNAIACANELRRLRPQGTVQ
jgi:aspartate-semialdehyde dehydrogenase